MQRLPIVGTVTFLAVLLAGSPGLAAEALPPDGEPSLVAMFGEIEARIVELGRSHDQLRDERDDMTSRLEVAHDNLAICRNNGEFLEIETQAALDDQHGELNRLEQMNAELVADNARLNSDLATALARLDDLSAAIGAAVVAAMPDIAPEQIVIPPTAEDGEDVQATALPRQRVPSAPARATATNAAGNLVADLALLTARETESGLVLTVPGDRLFSFDSTDIRPDASQHLTSLSRVLAFYAGRRARIVGHTDSTGDPAYNIDLSDRRAAAVLRYLDDVLEYDVSAITTGGVGAAEPIAGNATSDGRRANRRIEVLIGSPSSQISQRQSLQGDETSNGRTPI